MYSHTPPYTSFSLAIGKEALEGLIIFRCRVDYPTVEDWSNRIANQFHPYCKLQSEDTMMDHIGISVSCYLNTILTQIIGCKSKNTH